MMVNALRETNAAGAAIEEAASLLKTALKGCGQHRVGRVLVREPEHGLAAQPVAIGELVVAGGVEAGVGDGVEDAGP